MSGDSEVTLREMVRDDLPGALRLSRASGWNQTGEDWRFLLQENAGRFVAAVRGGRVVGTGGASCYSHRLAWVCMILVDEAERGHGVGSALVRWVLEHVLDMDTVGLDATPSGRPVYERLGFTASSSFVRVGGCADDAARVGDTAARPLETADMDAVLRLDRLAFGADRSPTIRWARAEAPALAWCVTEEGALAGYCLGRRGDRAVHVGPVVARSAPVARALVGRAAGAVTGRDLVLDVPTTTPEWLSTLPDLGFRVQRPFTRMYRAGSPPGDPGLVFAAFGPELG